MTEGTNSKYLREFSARLKALQAKRLPIAKVRSCFYEHSPEIEDHPERHIRLHQCLLEMEKLQLIKLPRTRKNWDNSSRPPLPIWINLVYETKRDVIDPLQISWVSEMAFCIDLTNRSQLEAAIAINRFLVQNRDQLAFRIPLRERSVQIFGDEKRLDSLAKRGGLFGGRLSLDVLQTFMLAPPIPHEHIDAFGKRILLVENHHTYWSLCQWNQSKKHYSAVAWSGGNSILKNTEGVAQLVGKFDASGFDYFGDLDVRGLEILFRLLLTMDKGYQINGLPAFDFYRWLARHGHRKDCSTSDDAGSDESSSKNSRNSDKNLSPYIFRHFSLDDGRNILQLLKAGQRIAQESLTYSVLLKEFM